ncbi:hypothetical protein [Corynebacterium glyciniphilum]|uniref:hypothetical protein n=1 Tax=Corynebacterium glyciniphilum TaxID=1404244 RepID=UPI00264A7E95|nr:hypothetical protein [Corynebacterium glyciniphilum]MDN5685004.1 hypothetical protein [Corynebacterium glyciniphilum]
MGAPAGHPFFGNQYTDGGYVPGQFSYAAARHIAGAPRRAAASLSKSSAGTRSSVPAAFVNGQHMLQFSVPSLIAGGAVALIGGVATFAYLRSKSVATSKPTVEGGEVASFGECESCGEPLTPSGLAELKQDEIGDFVTCPSCSHQNRARWVGEDDENQPESGSN